MLDCSGDSGLAVNREVRLKLATCRTKRVGNGNVDIVVPDVMTVEPAVFIKEEGLGVRLIDNCIITDSGIELLSTTPRDIALLQART